MKKVTQCSIRNCPLWKRAKLITGYCLLSILALAVIAAVGFIVYLDWKGAVTVIGGTALVFGMLFVGIDLIMSGEE